MSKESGDFNFYVPTKEESEVGFDKEILKRKKAMGVMLNDLTPEQQDFVTEVASFFLEKDIYDQYRESPEGVRDLSEGLKLAELSPEQVKTVMRYLNLPISIK